MLISKRNFAWVFSSGLFRSRNHPKDVTAGSGYAFFLGGSTSGKAVEESSTMQMAAVYSLDTGTSNRRTALAALSYNG